MADSRHFENRYNSISQPRIARIWRNLVRRRKFWARPRKCVKNSEIPTFKMADGRHIENYFSALCIVGLRRNLEFGGIIARTRRLDDENVRFRKSNMADGRHFEKSLYLHISAANRPNCTKFSMQTQFFYQATEMWQKSEIPKFEMADRRHIENHFFAITWLHHDD